MTTPDQTPIRRVLVADDLPEIRNRVCEMIEETPGFEAVGCPAAPHEVRRHVEAAKADAVVVDVFDRTTVDLLSDLRTIVADGLLIAVLRVDSGAIASMCRDAGADHVLIRLLDLQRLPDLLRDGDQLTP